MSIHHPTPPSRNSDFERTLTYVPARGAQGARRGEAYAPIRQPAPPLRPAPAYGPALRPTDGPAGAPPWAAAPLTPFGAAPAWPTPPWGGPSQPAPPTPAPTPPRPRRRKWLVAAAAIAVSAAAILGVVVSTGGGDEEVDARQATPTVESSAPSTPPAPPITSAELSDILLTPVEAAQIIDSSVLIGHEIDGTRIFEKMGSGKIVDQDCVSLLPAMETAYQGSGFVAVREQSLQDPVKNKRFTQSAVTFGDAAAATRYLEATKTAWEACANRSVDFGFTTLQSDHDFWSVGAVTEADGVLTFTKTQEGGDGWSCQSALTARNNVVVDLFTCGDHVSGLTAVRVANAMTNKVDDEQ